MHTTTGEVKSIADMLIGGTGSPPAYHTSRLGQQAEYEVHVNGRLKEQLQALHKVLLLQQIGSVLWWMVLCIHTVCILWFAALSCG